MSKKTMIQPEEFSRYLMLYMASFDCLTLAQCVMLKYAKTSPAGISSMQRKLKQMRQQGFIGRRKSGDGLYRYYLHEKGVQEVNKVLLFTATAGSDRSYINSSRRDALIDRVLADMHGLPDSRALGTGALRRSAGGMFKKFDGALVLERGGRTDVINFYVKIDTPNAIAIDRYRRLKLEAQRHRIPLIVVADARTKKILGV